MEDHRAGIKETFDVSQLSHDQITSSEWQNVASIS